MLEKTKFSNVDILEFMGKVVEKHTKFYHSDFEIDKEILSEAADRQEQQEKTFIWLCRTHGTWCLLERNVYLKGTRENNTFRFYAEHTSEPVLAFLIEVTGGTQDSVIPSLHKVIRRLALVLFDLKTGYICRQPVYPCESPGHRVCVLERV